MNMLLHWMCNFRVTEEGIQHLSVLSGLQELSFGYTSLPAADEIAATIAAQFSQLTGLWKRPLDSGCASATLT